MATVVLVHGAWHGGWCWYEVVPELESRGHDVVTVDLPGHGIDTTSIEEVTLDSATDRVCSVLDEQSEPVALVGHSMGGILITQAAERRPDAIDTLVYLTAFLPEDGTGLIDYAQADEEAIALPNLVVDEERGVCTIETEKRTEVFYHDCSPAHRELARTLLRPETMSLMTTPVNVSPTNFGSVRRAFVECTDDRAISLSMQRTMHEESGVDAVATLETSHSPFFSAPTGTADAIEEVVSR